MSWRAVAIVAVLLACGDAAREGTAGDLEPTTIAACSDPCPGIRLEHVGVLGSPDDSVLLDWRSTLAAGDSFIAAGNVPVPGVVPLYDFDGRQIRVVGRYGGGPGEFRGPRPVPGPGRSVWIFDVGNQRLAVLGPDGSIVRESPLWGGPVAAIPMGDTTLVVGFLVSDSLTMSEFGPRAESGTRIPPPFHFVRADGVILRSFGEWPGYPESPAAAVVGLTELLTEVPGRYRIERRGRDGRVEEVLERRAEWFVAPRLGERNIVRSNISAMRARGDTLWIRFAEPAGPYVGEQLSGRPELATMDSIYDTRIEVVDLSGPRVIASEVFDFPSLTFLAGSDLLYSHRQGPGGYVVTDLWQTEIVDSGR